jgi:hypothetical protein
MAIVEMRTYTIAPGRIPDYFALYEREGMAVQESYLGRMVGYYATEIGPVNEIVHMWRYFDLNDRVERRNRLKADARWQAYIVKMLPMLVSQHSRILTLAPFFAARNQGDTT